MASKHLPPSVSFLVPCGVQEYAKIREASIHCVQARGQGMYKILKELRSSYYCHKNVGKWAHGRSQNMFPREQKRSRTEQLDVGSGNWTIPMCVATVHAISCLGRLLQPVPPQTKVKKPLHEWEGKMEISYRGRKFFENYISVFRLFKEKLVYNSILSIGGVCVGGCVYAQNIWGKRTFTVVCQP